MFGYDSFGNVRSSQGAGVDSTGGDFRFQGQWLESATGIYHFRARDYDSRTGTFLSRDPVDLNEQQPEAMNPYQFAYNNPYIYSDPSGRITLAELNVAQSGQFVLQSLRTAATGAAKDYVKNLAGEVVSNLLFSSLDTFLPFTGGVFNAFKERDNGKTAGKAFEFFITDAICNTVTKPYLDYIWLQVRLNSDGKPFDDGLRCPPVLGNPSSRGPKPTPDFIFKKTEPTDLDEKSYLVGDVKLSVATMYRSYIKPGKQSSQWDAIKDHARNYSYAPLAGFLTFYSDSKGTYLRELQEKALKDGVAALILSIR